VRESVSAPSKTWLSATPADTEALGAKLAAAIVATRAERLAATSSDALFVVYLTGDLGAGKTTLARGFLHSLGIDEPIRSPTYTLLETYESPDLAVVHLDLYRLRDPDELEPLGLRDLARPSYVWLIEWAERGIGWLPAPDLDVRLVIGSDGHRIEARGVSDVGAACLSRIAA
jgi:tRNA threonylcarbamoyladenosine biosynthesis protein TsaE